MDALYEKAGESAMASGRCSAAFDASSAATAHCVPTVALPEGAATPIDDAALDPRVLDSCLQVIIAELMAQEDSATGPLLPERIDRIVIDGPLGRAATVSATTKLDAQEGRGEFALSIADAQGHTRLRIEGLHARAIEGGARAEAEGEPIFVEETFVEAEHRARRRAGEALDHRLGADGRARERAGRALATEGKQAVACRRSK